MRPFWEFKSCNASIDEPSALPWPFANLSIRIILIPWSITCKVVRTHNTFSQKSKSIVKYCIDQFEWTANSSITQVFIFVSILRSKTCKVVNIKDACMIFMTIFCKILYRSIRVNCYLFDYSSIHICLDTVINNLQGCKH